MADLLLRDYRQTLVAGTRHVWTRTRSVLAWMPTGGGKTEISVNLAQTGKNPERIQRQQING